jgi:hypothetical protein
MQIDLYILAAAFLGALLSGTAVACYFNLLHRGLYNRGWNAGRDYATRQAHDHTLR